MHSGYSWYADLNSTYDHIKFFYRSLMAILTKYWANYIV